MSVFNLMCVVDRLTERIFHSTDWKSQRIQHLQNEMNVPLNITDHFGDKSCQASDCTGSPNSSQPRETAHKTNPTEY